MRTGPRDVGSVGGSGGASDPAIARVSHIPWPCGSQRAVVDQAWDRLIVVHHGWGRSSDNLDQPLSLPESPATAHGRAALRHRHLPLHRHRGEHRAVGVPTSGRWPRRSNVTLALLDTAIHAHGGVHFKTVGDAVQAAFPTASDAVAAALEGRSFSQGAPDDRAASHPPTMKMMARQGRPRRRTHSMPFSLIMPRHGRPAARRRSVRRGSSTVLVSRRHAQRATVGAGHSACSRTGVAVLDTQLDRLGGEAPVWRHRPRHASQTPTIALIE